MPTVINKTERIQTMNGYRPEIDGIRALAVVCVIVNHFNKSVLPSGFLGVDIFFVISGFVITSSLHRRSSKNLSELITSFYNRRVKRLLPALAVYVVVMSISICFFNPEPGNSLQTGLTSLIGFSNLTILKSTTDYFARSSELNVFTHTWSLGVEEQFYLLFPFLIWFSGFGRRTNNGSRNLILIVGICALASLSRFILIYPSNQSQAYFLMPSRFWEIAAGCLVYLIQIRSSSIYWLSNKTLSSLLLFLIVGIMFMPTAWAVSSTILVVALTSSLVFLIVPQAKAYELLTDSRVVYVGLISYSLYLWHWGVLSISRWTIGVHWWSIPFQLLIMIGLAVASYRFIEKPFRAGNWFDNRWKTLVLGGGSLVVITPLLSMLAGLPRDSLYLGRYPLPIMMDDYSRHFAATRERCNIEHYSESNCLIPSRSGGPQRFLLYGDSHAGHLIPLIGDIYANNNIAVNVSISGGYPRLLNNNTISSIVEIDELERRFSDFSSDLRAGDVVILSSRWEHHLHEDYYNLPERNRARKLFFSDDLEQISGSEVIDLFYTKLTNISQRLDALGVRIIIFAPLPVFRGETSPVPYYLCQEEWFRPFKSSWCSLGYEEPRARIIARNKNINKAFARLERENSNLYIYDPFDILCPGKTLCTTHVGDIQSFRDDDHLSRAGSKLLYQSFSEFLKNNKLLRFQ